MKLFGLEFKFNGFDIWHKGNFDPTTKADTSHAHTKANITDFPSSMPANGGTSDTVNFIDSRSVNDLPSGLISRKLSLAFKSRTSVGSPPVGASTTYAYILNIVGWNGSEGSGGWPIQLAVGTEGLAYRQATSASAWGSWIKISNLSDMPTNLSQLTNDSDYITSSGAPVQSVAGRTGVISLTSTDVGLANVNNTSDANKPVSTAQQAALNLKANLASPVFTGTPKSVTPTTADNSTNIATTAFVKAQGYITSAGSGAKIAVATTAPSSPSPGDFWYQVI